MGRSPNEPPWDSLHVCHEVSQLGHAHRPGVPTWFHIVAQNNLIPTNELQYY